MTDPTRRAILAASLAAVAGGALASVAGPAHAQPGPDEDPKDNDPKAPNKPKPLKILVLGGTVFLGPATVDAALARGHEITLFNRGKTNPHLYPELEKIKGDRNGDHSALKGRTWDAVIDTYGQVPKQVTTAATVLKDAVKHYVFVSTISVYPAFGTSAGTIDETAATAPMPDPMPKHPMQAYGANKAASERAAEAVMPGRVANVRPGLIVGPRDRSDRFTYWPMRLDAGGDVVAPGDGTAEIQFIDVRDLGAWLVRLCEARTAGVFNAVGFAEKVTIADLVNGCQRATKTPSKIHWLPDAFLETQNARPWRDFPLYLPEEGRTIVSNARAIKAGLTFRPIDDTIRATLDWARTKRGKHPLRFGLDPVREEKIFEAWEHRKDDDGPKDDSKDDVEVDK